MGNSADGSRNGARSSGTRALRNPNKLAPGSVRLLEEADFTYDGRIGSWLNIPAGRVIAFDRVANRSPEWLAAWLGLSRFHPLFIANGHDVRTVRSGSPAVVLEALNGASDLAHRRTTCELVRPTRARRSSVDFQP